MPDPACHNTNTAKLLLKMPKSKTTRINIKKSLPSTNNSLLILSTDRDKELSKNLRKLKKNQNRPTCQNM